MGVVNFDTSKMIPKSAVFCILLLFSIGLAEEVVGNKRSAEQLLTRVMRGNDFLIRALRSQNPEKILMHEMLENEEKNLREGGMDKKWSEDMLVRNMRSSDMLMRALRSPDFLSRAMRSYLVRTMR